jgi:hypothetical protein
MRYGFILLLTTAMVLFSCNNKKDVAMPAVTPSSVSTVLLKDIVEARLPSPYYHFEYDETGKVSFASFASDLTRYNIVYRNQRISEMRNNTIVNKDRLHYVYDETGRVTVVRYIDSADVVFTKLKLTYDEHHLIKLTRMQKSGTKFVIDKITTFSYQTDGNLSEVTYHYLPFEGQTETTFTDKFENYDNKVNVDGFSVLHNDFFDHLVLLPDVHLQLNNPQKETRSGDGLNYVVNYTYTYNDKNAPLTKKGQLTITSNGSDKGDVISTSTTFSYY